MINHKPFHPSFPLQYYVPTQLHKMEPKESPLKAFSCILMTLLLLFGSASSDVNQDKEKCANQLVGLATCLAYVAGEAKAPPPDCCTGLKQVLDNSKECLCLLVKDRNDPSLGLKINATLALSLPDICHTPANISDCPALLHLAPNSPEAKVFDDFAKSAKGSNSTSTAGGSPNGQSPMAGVNSNGERRSWLRIEMAALGLIITVALHVLTDV